MRFSDWHKAITWQERSAILGRFCLLLAIAALPVHGPLVPIPLALGIVLLLPQAWAFHKLKNKGLLLLPVTFYLLHVLGMTWTTDVDFGLFDLEVKLSLLLVPMIAAGLVASAERDMLRPAMVALSAGLLVAMVISGWSASTCYGEHGWKECFTQSYLSTLVHPSYMAWFASWALLHWGRLLINGSRSGTGRRMASGTFVLLLIVYIIMLASKSGLIGLVLVLAVLVATAVKRVPGPRRWLLVPGLVVVLAVPATIFSRVLSVRLGEAVQAVERLLDRDATYVEAESSSDERLVAWSCSVQCLSASPWGAGTGDIKHALMACYQEKGATAAIQHKLNSHSQVLQSGVALGWPGLLLVCAMMVAPLALGIYRRDLFLAIFALLFIINGAIESVLEVQAGVVFFILFFVILVRRKPLPEPHAHP